VKLLSVNYSPVADKSGRKNRPQGDGDQAAAADSHTGVTVLTYEHYRYWAERFGFREIPFGRFGEDVTVEGMTEDRVHVGDVFRIGSAMFEISRPCQLSPGVGQGMDMPEFSRLIMETGRVGFFLRVLIAGKAGAGDDIERLKVDPRRMTVRRVHELRHFQRQNIEGARRATSIPALSPAWRREFQAIVDAADRIPPSDIGCCNLPV
jgi:MOSC domain-containing protein YiiM